MKAEQQQALLDLLQAVRDRRHTLNKVLSVPGLNGRKPIKENSDTLNRLNEALAACDRADL